MLCCSYSLVTSFMSIRLISAVISVYRPMISMPPAMSTSQHIFWIRPNQVAAQVKALPWIADAHVSMALPNKVTIQVQEREPLVALQTISTTTWFAD